MTRIWLLLAALALVSPAAAQSADTIQARMTEALDALVRADQLSKDAEGLPANERGPLHAEAESHWKQAISLYAAVLVDVNQVELPPAARDEVVRIALYNTSCAQARLGQTDVALQSLNRALEAGYQDFRRIELDPDLTLLREEPRFVQLLERARAKLEAEARAAAKQVLSPNALFAYDLDVTTMDGRQLRLSDLAGKVVIVDFWGTWCPPCRQEIPHFVALQEKYGDQLQIVGMTFERTPPGAETEAKVKAFAEQVGINYALVMATREQLQDVPQLEAFPTTLFLDKQGRVRAREVGYRDQDAIEGLIQALLAEEEQAPAPAQPERGGGIGPF